MTYIFKFQDNSIHNFAEGFEIFGTLLFLLSVLYFVYFKKFYHMYRFYKKEEEREERMIKREREKYEFRY